MVSVGEKLHLGFEIKAAIKGEKWQGQFGGLVKGPTLISVYMKNNTGSCDRQMHSLAEGSSRIRKLGYQILGISKDTVGSHVRYAEKQGIDFPLVSDPEYHFAKATGSLVEKKMYGKTFLGPSRSAYVIDERGLVLGFAEKVDAANHLDQVLELIAKIR